MITFLMSFVGLLLFLQECIIELNACFNTGDLGSPLDAYLARYSTHAW